MDPTALADRLEAEAAYVWQGWPGALAVAAAACVAGEDLAAIQALPDTGGRPDRIVLQRGHVVAIGGGSIPQLLRLGGARTVEVGAVDRCAPAELAAALRDAVAGLYVAADGMAPGLVGLAPFCWACQEAKRPALVLILGRLPATAALDAGAGLVVVEIEGSGVVAGAEPLVRACRLQASGIGRAFVREGGTS